jgi:hypothetical protein
MPSMYQSQDQAPPSDVCLLLRAYAEQRWLSREVVTVLRQLETPDELPDEQLGAALAYLEVVWIEALRHSAETDAAFAALDEEPLEPGLTGGALPSTARRYHSAVLALREAVAKHVTKLLAGPEQGDDRVGSAPLEPGVRSAIPLDLL